MAGGWDSSSVYQCDRGRVSSTASFDGSFSHLSLFFNDPRLSSDVWIDGILLYPFAFCLFVFCSLLFCFCCCFLLLLFLLPCQTTEMCQMFFHWCFMYTHWGFWNKFLDLTWLATGVMSYVSHIMCCWRLLPLVTPSHERNFPLAMFMRNTSVSCSFQRVTEVG